MQFDEDSIRLPEGMKRIAYDADTRIYTFRDQYGALYRGSPGEDYGVLTPVPKSTTITRRGAFADPNHPLDDEYIVDEPAARGASFEDFLPARALTKATSPIDGSSKTRSPLFSHSSNGDREKRNPRTIFQEAVRKATLPKMQGVVHNLRRSMTSAKRGPRNGEGSSSRTLRERLSADLARSPSVASSVTVVAHRD